MTETTAHVLTRYEWVEQPVDRIRMKFRRDSTGFYEREGLPGTRLIHENFLFKLEGGQLHLKFSHAREWSAVPMDVREGQAEKDARFGQWEMFLSHDPYAWLFEEVDSGSLILLSDTGAALLG